MERMASTQLRHRTAAVAMALLIAHGAAFAQTKVKPGFNLFSADQDVQIGQQSAQEAEQQLPLLNDSRVQNYVNNIGQRLAAVAGGPKFQYRFRVVNASDINAFALPGGFVYINRGTLDAAKSDGEVAGVLAHEIAHDVLRHGTHAASQQYLTQAGVGILGGILGGRVGEGTAQIINAVGGFGLNALFLRHSRTAETEADVLGSQIMAKAGYSPGDMVSFFRTLAASDKRSIATWLSDHPQTTDRIKRVQQEEVKIASKAPAGVRTAAFNDVKSTLSRMSPAPSMAQIAQGVAPSTSSGTRSRPATSGSQSASIPAPSSSMKTYTNQTAIFQVQYPSNWDVVSQGSNGVTFSPPGGYGQVNGNNEIVYGAVVSHFEPQQGFGRMTAADATNELVSAIQQSSPYLSVISGSKQSLRSSGGSALSAALRGTDPNTGILERVTVMTRQLGDGHLIYLLFITPERELATYSRVLNAMASSLRIDPNHSH